MLGRAKTGALKVGLWVVLDQQYDDALKLLENPEHVPAYQLSDEEMDSIKATAINDQQAKFQIYIEKFATWGLVLVLLVLASYVFFGVISGA